MITKALVMSVKPENIKLLREKTGAGMMDCKSALNETDGDLERAEEWLRKKGINTAQKKSAREASEGLITVSIKDSCGVIIEINSETDFVARNENFQKFCLDITNLCLIKKIDDKESLLKTEFSDSGKTVEDELTNVISKLGENIVIKKLNYEFGKGYFFQKYLHSAISENSGKIGVLLSFNAKHFNEKVDLFSKQLCMHIAASDPIAMEVEGLDQEIINKERAIYHEQLKSSGKPDNILEKIVDGKIKKFYTEVCLLEQIFVIDNKTPIKESIINFNKENNDDFKINNFIMYKLGQD